MPSMVVVFAREGDVAPAAPGVIAGRRRHHLVQRVDKILRMTGTRRLTWPVSRRARIRASGARASTRLADGIRLMRLSCGTVRVATTRLELLNLLSAPLSRPRSRPGSVGTGASLGRYASTRSSPPRNFGRRGRRRLIRGGGALDTITEWTYRPRQARISVR
jgi:hypothetical protein